MKKKNTWILWVLGFALLFIVASAMYEQLGDEIGAPSADSENETQDKEEHKRKAPDFVVYDEEGNEVRLSDFLGKPVVLNFWASWCGPCKREMPDFQSVYEEYGEQVQFLMVNATDGDRETKEKAMEMIAQEGYTFPVFYDTKMNASETYAVYSIPRTYLIDEEGHLIDSYYGVVSEKRLLNGIKEIL